MEETSITKRYNCVSCIKTIIDTIEERKSSGEAQEFVIDELKVYYYKSRSSLSALV